MRIVEQQVPSWDRLLLDLHEFLARPLIAARVAVSADVAKRYCITDLRLGVSGQAGGSGNSADGHGQVRLRQQKIRHPVLHRARESCTTSS
jgi:hypothetical protein